MSNPTKPDWLRPEQKVRYYADPAYPGGPRRLIDHPTKIVCIGEKRVTIEISPPGRRPIKKYVSEKHIEPVTE